MKKHLSCLSFILAFAMLIGIFSSFSYAFEKNGEEVLNAYYSSESISDGSASEIPLSSSALISVGGSLSVGASWNKKNIVLYIDGAENMSIGIKISGHSLGVSQSGAVSGIEGASCRVGDLTEIIIPIDKTDIEISEFEQEIPLVISVGSDDIFNGCVRLSSAEFNALPYNSFDLVGNGAGQSISKDGPLSFYAPSGKAGRSYIICSNNNILSNHNGTGVLEVTVDAKAIPVFYDAPVTEKLIDECARICDGFAVGVNYNVPDGYGFTFNLTNIKDMGLCLVLTLDNDKAVTVPLERSSGDRFRLRFEYNFDGKSVDIYADTDHVGHVDGLIADSFWGTRTVNQVSFNLWADSMPSEFDVSVSDILVGNYYEPDIVSYFNADEILGDNSSLLQVTTDLDLKSEFLYKDFTVPVSVSYRSSNEDVLNSKTGKINRPEKGVENLTLTVIIDGKERDFEVFVVGENELSYKYLVVENDIATAKGRGVEWKEMMFALDKNNNSVVVDLGATTPFNSVKLYDSDRICRLNAESVTLWVSDDNKSYTQVEEFKFLRDGKHTYLYGFEAKSRYIKVHYTHFDNMDSDFYAPLSGMLVPNYENVFGVQDNDLSKTSTTVTNKGASPIRDGVFELSLTSLGVSGDHASIRVFYGEEILYHYTDGDRLLVRVPVLDAGESLELTVMFGAEGAIDISNEEAVYEVNYGTRESYLSSGDHRWLLKIPAGTKFPNGDVSEREVLISWTNTVIYGSYDGGRSWIKYGKVQSGLNTQLDGIGDSYSGGFIFDDVTGRIFYETHCYNGFNGGDMSRSDCINKVLYSDDGGKNWKMADVLEPDTVDGKTFKYMLSYSDGIKVSSYDGEGPNVDFVFPTGAQFNNKGAFCARVAYSKDGGFTWQYSKNLLIYGDGSSFEGGMSEAYILENEKGVLVLYCRCQFNYVDRFAMAYSYDNGVTWTAEKTKGAWEAKKDSAPNEVCCLLSTVYATNTQPVMFKYDGAPIFLWGGNNALNAGSYIRNPLNLAVSYDGLETWENIQNLFSETPHETYLGTHFITNPSAQKIGADGLAVTFDRLMHKDTVMMRVSDLTKFLYLTKGAYDSFESATPKYEGWITYKGGVGLSDDKASYGKYSMFISKNSIISRSIPYFTEGEISFDVFANEGTNTAFELQPAFSKDSGKYAYLSVSINGMKLSVGNKTIDLTDGWNKVTIDIGDTSSVSANGKTVNVSLNKAVGEYVCYAVFFANSSVYIDGFKVVEDADEKIYLSGESEKRVKDIYDRIKDLGEITTESVEEVEAIRAELNSLTVSEQLAVYNISTLKAAEMAIAAGELPNIELDVDDVPDGDDKEGDGNGCGCGALIDGSIWFLVGALAVIAITIRMRRSHNN